MINAVERKKSDQGGIETWKSVPVTSSSGAERNQTKVGLKPDIMVDMTPLDPRKKSDQGGIETDHHLLRTEKRGGKKSDQGGIETINSSASVTICLGKKSDQGGIETYAG
ncbi:MAG: hypothetical protein OD814_001741 [Candidatus Alkanophagales archaeon MCA70_species_1]|nr:hypothetical protein [Candidatus Alkanophaga volatiphilum]